MRAVIALFITWGLLTTVSSAEEIRDYYAEPGLNPFKETIDQNFHEHIDPFSGTLQLKYTDLIVADFRKPLTFLISTHLRALSVPTFGVIVELRCINAGTDNSIHGGSYAR